MRHVRAHDRVGCNVARRTGVHGLERGLEVVLGDEGAIAEQVGNAPGAGRGALGGDLRLGIERRHGRFGGRAEQGDARHQVRLGLPVRAVVFGGVNAEHDVDLAAIERRCGVVAHVDDLDLQAHLVGQVARDIDVDADDVGTRIVGRLAGERGVRSVHADAQRAVLAERCRGNGLVLGRGLVFLGIAAREQQARTGGDRADDYCDLPTFHPCLLMFATPRSSLSSAGRHAASCVSSG